jgi:hypothetical protein
MEHHPADPRLLQDPLLAAVDAVDGRKVLGTCVLLRELGRGGFGAVYLAWHRTFALEVAVKCMLPPRSAKVQEEIVRRFLREGRAAARLNHPNLVRIYHLDEHRGLLYQVLEYAERGSVWDLVRSRGRLPVPEALRIVLEAAQGVACAHRSGVVHRDLKPGNLLLDGDDAVKVADLGLAGLMEGSGERLSLSGQGLGTPGYMPPEQQEDLRQAGKPADVWALGSTLFTLLHGRPAFAGSTPLEVVRRVDREDFPALPAEIDAHPGLKAVLERATRRDPGERYKDAAEMAAALEDLRRVVHDRSSATTPRTSRLVVPGFCFLARNPQGYEEYQHEQTGLIFVLLPGGRFRMGSPNTETGRRVDEGPVHEVDLGPFLIAKYEVTQEVWARVMGANPSHFSGEKGLPVDSLSWEDCGAFCGRTGLELPTEAQWEFAVRAGTQTPYSFGETITMEERLCIPRPTGRVVEQRRQALPVGVPLWARPLCAVGLRRLPPRLLPARA